MSVPSALGRFEIRHLIGEGGMGVVYEALDTRSAAVVALKTLPRFDADSIARLKNEFRSLAHIVHPNLVRLYELFGVGDQWFFTMRRVSGVQFLEHVRVDAATGFENTMVADQQTIAANRPAGIAQGPYRGGFRELSLRSALLELVVGVDAIHRAGKLHRDLKPSNVLVERGRVVILDFGLVSDRAAAATGLLQDTTSGTPAYMSPEQAAGVPLGPESDWYAVGVMLYEALTGELPFTGSAAEMLKAKLEQTPITPGNVARRVSEDLGHLCMDLLQRDPALRPTCSEILERIGGSRAPPSHEPVTDDTPAFVGRAAELAALERALESVGVQPRVVLIEGESGIGKSELLRHFARRLHTNHALVLTGRCYERESIPFKVFDGMIEQLAGHLHASTDAEAMRRAGPQLWALSRLFPALGSVPALGRAQAPTDGDFEPQEVRSRAFIALKQVLRSVAARVVLCADDLQWGDADSGSLLAELIAPPDPPSILFVGTHRPLHAHAFPFLEQMLESTGKRRGDAVERIVLQPLAQSEAQALAAQWAGGEPGVAAQIARETGGRPFFVRELAHYLREQRAKASGKMVSLEEAVQARVAALPAEARSLLELLSVAGRPTPRRVALEAAGLELRDGEGLELLRSVSLARTTGPAPDDSGEPYHDRIREIVIAGLGRDELRARHLRLARVLEPTGAEAEWLADHFEGAGLLDDAVRYAELAGDQANSAFAFAGAAAQYERAVALGALAPEALRRVQLKRGQSLANAGRGVEAARIYLEFAGGNDPHETRALERAAAEQLLRAGKLDESAQLFRRVLRPAGVSYPGSLPATLARFAWARLRIRWRGLGFQLINTDEVPAPVLDVLRAFRASYAIGHFDPLRGATLMAEYCLAALDAGEPDHVMHVIVGEGVYAALAGGPTAEQKVAELEPTVRDLADRIDTPDAHFRLRFFAVYTNLLLGRWNAIPVPALEAASVAGADAFARNDLRAKRFSAELLLGRFRGVHAELSQALREARERADLYDMGSLLPLLSINELARDCPREARAMLDEFDARLGDTDFGINHSTAMNQRLNVALYERDVSGARATLAASGRRFARSTVGRAQMLRVLATQARASTLLRAAELGRGAFRQDVALAEASIGALQREGMSWTEPIARGLRGRLLALRGDSAGAVRELDAAIAGYRSLNVDGAANAFLMRRGQLLGGDEGKRQIALGDRALRENGVENPQLWAAMNAGVDD